MNEQQLDYNKTTGVSCESCKNETFRGVVFLRKLSRFVSPDGQDHVVPMESMECAKCGHINADFNPNPIVSSPKEDVSIEDKQESADS